MNTKIANRIYITDPSIEVDRWAKDNLQFPNPEYEKKQRMGFWVGRTPKMLRLYEWNGGTLILPFGVCRELMPMLKGTPVMCDFRQDNVINYGGTPVPLYDYQKDAVRSMIEARYGILKSKPGSGKTQMGIALIKAHKRRALWLCHTADLLNQSRDRALQYIDKDVIGTITEGKVNVGIGVTFATVQTMCNLDLTQYRDYWDVVIVDECFPGYTVITTIDGYKQIKDIKEGDVVLTRNDSGMLEYKRVTALFRKKPKSLVDVILSDGTGIICTGNHPILTEGGYKRADELTDNDAVYRVRETGGHLLDEPAKEKQPSAWQRALILLRRVSEKSRKCLDGRAKRNFPAVDEKSQQRKSIRADEATQSVIQSGNAEKDIRIITENGTQTADTRWERTRADNTATDTCECFEATDTINGVCSANKGPKRKRVSDKLQIGYCNSGIKTGDRSGRKFSLPNKKTGTRPEERFISRYVGVDRVEVQKQTGDGTYGGLCPDGYVYNIEVEGNHNYFANGINVHNCHRVSSSATTFTRYEKVLNHLSARHKYGLTATPERSDGLIKATFALLGNVAYEVPDSAVADRTMGVKIRPVETGFEITDECLNDDGTINYVKLIEALTEDIRRNELIASTIYENMGHSCLILSDRLDQLKDIMETISMMPGNMIDDCAYIDGKMQSKKAKVEREQALEDMRTGKKKYLFASYSLAKEGLDVPCLDRLFLASPCKFSAIITQAVGRVQRTCPGKDTPIVYDFVDVNVGFCNGAYKKRCTSYRKMGAEIEKG